MNHGFIVNNVQQRVAQWKAAGVKVLPGNNNNPAQAFVETPDGVRIASAPVAHFNVTAQWNRR